MPLFREFWSEEVVTPPGLVHWIEQQPERAAMQVWVADEGGELVAFANARFRWALQEPGDRRPLGRRPPLAPAARARDPLYELAEAHALDRDARQLGSTVREDEEIGRAFAKHRGYRETRREQYWSLEVEQAAASAEPAGGRADRPAS